MTDQLHFSPALPDKKFCAQVWDANGVSVAVLDRIDDEGTRLARLFAASADLLAAAQMLEDAEDKRQFCEECDGGDGEAEACGTCFPFFDDARVARRLAIQKALHGDSSSTPTPEVKS